MRALVMRYEIYAMERRRCARRGANAVVVKSFLCGDISGSVPT